MDRRQAIKATVAATVTLATGATAMATTENSYIPLTLKPKQSFYNVNHISMLARQENCTLITMHGQTYLIEEPFSVVAEKIDKKMQSLSPDYDGPIFVELKEVTGQVPMYGDDRQSDDKGTD